MFRNQTFKSNVPNSFLSSRRKQELISLKQNQSFSAFGLCFEPDTVLIITAYSTGGMGTTEAGRPVNSTQKFRECFY